MQPHQKPGFNQLARSEDVCLVIATGEMAIYANILITIGVVNGGQREE
jgi:L-fucose mutarotase/ribose pyranase (RbsD/FucU family)